MAIESSIEQERDPNQPLDGSRIVLQWYDFLCPYCYIGQSRDDILERHGLTIIQLPFQAHPEIPRGGITIGSRVGSMYATLDKEAAELGLPLIWPPRLPNTRVALGAAEWVRRFHPKVSAAFNRALFSAHFAFGEDLEDEIVIDSHALALGVNLRALHLSLADGSSERAVEEAETLGRELGVQGTPAWFISGQLIPGLLPATEFERLAAISTEFGLNRQESKP